MRTVVAGRPQQRAGVEQQRRQEQKQQEQRQQCQKPAKQTKSALAYIGGLSNHSYWGKTWAGQVTSGEEEAQTKSLGQQALDEVHPAFMTALFDLDKLTGKLPQSAMTVTSQPVAAAVAAKLPSNSIHVEA